MSRFVHEDETCPECKKGKLYWNLYCGAYVCTDCSYHKDLARCFCGWRKNKAEPYGGNLSDL